MTKWPKRCYQCLQSIIQFVKLLATPPFILLINNKIIFILAVYKCPPLPFVSGGSAECTAGQALGSKCLWKCDHGKKLVGSSLMTCGGHKKSPTWSHNSPKCEDTGKTDKS